MKEEERNTHPGWSVRFIDGTWLGGPHGWYQHKDAFDADIFPSKEDATYFVKISEIKDDFEIVAAWEPLCERLRVEIKSLKKVNKVTPSDLFDLEREAENLLDKIKSMV